MDMAPFCNVPFVSAMKQLSFMKQLGYTLPAFTNTVEE